MFDGLFVVGAPVAAVAEGVVGSRCVSERTCLDAGAYLPFSTR
jgi:hypothetical protein